MMLLFTSIGVFLLVLWLLVLVTAQINLQKISLTTVLFYLKCKDVPRQSNAPLGAWLPQFCSYCMWVDYFADSDLVRWVEIVFFSPLGVWWVVGRGWVERQCTENVLQTQFQRIVASNEDVRWGCPCFFHQFGLCCFGPVGCGWVRWVGGCVLLTRLCAWRCCVSCHRCPTWPDMRITRFVERTPLSPK